MRDLNLISFIRRERGRLVEYARSLRLDLAEMDAEDLVHDVLVKLIERPEATLSLENLAGYVYRSLRNRAIDLRRTRRSTVSLTAEGAAEPESLRDVLADDRGEALAKLQSDEGRRAVFEALEQLSEMERRVIIAHEFEGMSFREMAIEWEIPQNTLLSHKARAIKKLKQHFSRADGETS